MYEVHTDHQIVAFGPNLMQLFESNTGNLIVTATRSDDEWTIAAEGVPDVTATSRHAAITAMTEQALAALGGSGYSTLVPHGLSDMP